MNRDKTIFVVEDDTSIRNTIDMILSDVGYKVCTFGDVDMALATISDLHSKLPDLIITDINMIHDGIEFMKKLDALKVAVPIIPITAGKLVEAFGREVLKKPFSVEALLERVSDSLEQK